MAIPSLHESAALRAHGLTPGWWFQAKEEIVARFLRPYCLAEASIVVLACGGGGSVRQLRRMAPRARILGLDIDPQAIADCRAQDPLGTYQIADLEVDSVGPPGQADIVVALDILEHLRNDAAALSRIATALRPGGLLAVNVPAHPWLFSAHDERLGHLRRYRPKEMEALVVRQGFEVQHSTPLFMTTLIVLSAWRPLTRFSRQLSSQSDVGRRLPQPADRLLYAIARAEGVVARFRLPFGSSHFLLARKQSLPCLNHS